VPLAVFVRFISVALAWAWLLLCASASAASQPSTAPQFRVDAAMHTAAIGQIRADAPRNRVVTLGSDRTVRIWQLPALRLVRVLRLPQEGSVEGLPIGLAISPDGRTIAVGGWTGKTWEGTTSIYLYDSVTGRMTRRVGGFDDLVSALDWSPDGRFLAVGLAGTRGVKMLDTSTWKPIAQDAQYQDSVNFLHFSTQGLLAASAADGAVRLYDAGFKLLARQSVGVSRLLGGVRFSPDGKLLALGIIDQPLAMVLKVPTLDLATLRQVPDAQQKGLCCIAWSRDGSALFVNGEYPGSGATPLYRFGNGGLGSVQALPVGNQRFANMLPLPDGGLLFATTTPSLTLLDARGSVVRSVDTVVGDFRDGQQKLLASADGRGISVPMARFGQKPRALSVDDLDLPPIAASLLPPRMSAAGVTLDGLATDGSGAAMGAAVRINGRALDIHPGDKVNAHAFAHDGSAVYLGTHWHVMKLDRAGASLWRQDFGSEVRGLNAVANGAYLLVSLADGTVRWLNQSDGREQLAYFPHNNGRDWVLWRPDGYYASSDAGDQYVGWHVNRGLEQEPDFYRAVQFERAFYRPDLVRSALGGEPIRMRDGRPAPAAVAAAPLPSPTSMLALELEPIAPARLAIEDTQTRINARGRVEITIKLAARARTLPMQQLAVYVNDLPVTPTRQRVLSGGERTRLERTITVESDQAQNDIRVEIDHGQSLGLVETYAELAGAAPTRAAAAPSGKLIVLAIGIDRFVNVPANRKEELQDLEFAARDAQAFSATLERSTRGLFSEVKAVMLNDDTATKPDKAEIRKALTLLSEAGPDDTVMLFLASHGFSDRAGNYFFMPRDGRYEDALNVVQGRGSVLGKAPSLIEGNEFFDALRQSAGRRMLIVDTCHAKRIDGSLDTHSLRKRSAASNFAFMVAASGEEESQEYRPGGHGLFTYALLESFKPQGDANGDGVVTLAEAFGHLAPIVEKLRAPKLKQTPQLIAPDILLSRPIVSLARQ